MLAERALAVLIATAGAVACAASPPVYYQGNAHSWRIPLVGPLENAELVVPVVIDGKGPYLFAVDPDTGASRIDMGVADAVGLYRINAYTRVVGSDGHSRPFPVYEVGEVQAGDLTLRNFEALGVPPGSLRFNGRPVAGVLGNNIFTSTIVLDVDRDAGVLRLALTGHEVPPALAHSIDARISYRAMYVPVEVDGHEVELRVHLGSRFCSLWPRVAARLGVPFGRETERIRQPTAEIPLQFGPRAVVVELAGAAPAEQVRFTSHYDSTSYETRFDGVLGLNYLARFHLLMDRDDGRLWLAPRDRDLAEGAAARIARWQHAFSGCRTPGCVDTVVTPGAEGDPPRLLLRRSDGVTVDGFEAVVEALDAAGRPLASPLVRVSFPRGVRDVTVSEPRFAAMVAHAAAYRVVDLSPYPSECQGPACLEPLDRFPR